MKIAELRIGNFVFTTTSGFEDYIVVDGIYEGKICFSDGDMFDPKYVDPIELTEEWLIKFGIKKETDTAQGIGDYNWWNCHNKFEINHDIGGWFIIELGNHRFNYVHELQNIFHALTGSELHIGGEGIKT